MGQICRLRISAAMCKRPKVDLGSSLHVRGGASAHGRPFAARGWEALGVDELDGLQLLLQQAGELAVLGRGGAGWPGPPARPKLTDPGGEGCPGVRHYYF